MSLRIRVFLCAVLPQAPWSARKAELAQETSKKRLEEVREDASEPPRDYAPKTDPKDSGTLAEDFGLKKGDKAQQA